MAKIAFAFTDNQGKLHGTAEAAVVADLSMILGRLGAEAGITSGLAKLIIEKREEIEHAFSDLDKMVGGVMPEPIKLQLLEGAVDVDAHA